MKKNKKNFIASFVIFCLLSTGLPADFVFAKTNVQKQQTATDVPTIHPRSSWSTSTYEKRTKKVWPAEIATPEVIIIHHTATNYKTSTSKQIKKIYKYHSYTKKWGDIGYNYIIGSDGYIFEGRYGGNGVIGGHSYYKGTNYNDGSIGIAVLGNYESEKMTEAAQASLDKLVGWLAANNNINANSSVKFHGKKLDSGVVGHKDVASTACPGKNIYNKFSNIRSKSFGYSSNFQKYAYQISGESEKFEILKGKRYSGSARSSVAEISKTQIDAYPLSSSGENTETVYPTGTLVKVSEENKRGIIENGSLRTISAGSVLDSSYDASSFVDISSEKWASYPSGAAAGFRNGAFLKDESGNHFVISGRQKRKLALAEADLKLVDLNSAHSASSSELAEYADGGAIESLTDFPEEALVTGNYKTYYYISGNKKKKITKNVFRATFSRGMAIKVSANFLKKYKTSGKLSFRNGAVVNYRNKYFFIENGMRRQFARKSLATEMGFKNIVKAKRTEMSGIGQGSNIE